MRILVIDDDFLMARSIQRGLREHVVEIETDSARGVARVMNASADIEPFDVVLCDFEMPGRNGLDVFAALRSHIEPPILVLMSGYDDVVDALFIADAVLIKPFRAGEIGTTVDRIKARRSYAQTRRIRPMAPTTAEIRRGDGAAPPSVARPTK